MQKTDTLLTLLFVPLELDEEGLVSGPEEPLEPVRYHKLQAVDPTRQLNWRMRRARWLTRRKRDGDPRYDDGATLSAQRYLLGKRDGNTGEGFADIELAEHIHKGNRVRRLEIQARLLARQAPKEIAKRVGLPADAVAVYEALFFQIKDRLNATDWIRKRAIKGEVFSHSRESRTDVIVKSFAYFGGIQVLELIWPYLIHKSGPLAAPVQLDTVEGRKLEKVRLVLLAQSLPLDAQTNRRLTVGYPDFLELLKPIQQPVGRGVASVLMGPLPGSLARTLRKEVADHAPLHVEAGHDAYKRVRETRLSVEVA